MMIYTAKIQWKKCLLALAAVLALLTAIALLAHHSGAEDSAATFGSKTGKDDASRVAYLTQLGWQVSPEPVGQEEVLIPEVLDDATYGPYLALQAEAGFDLSQCAGKTVTRYTYQVLNYPTGETDIVAGLLVYQGQIVGGEIMSVALDGFIQSLVYPVQ
jgi:hypothetical protein